MGRGIAGGLSSVRQIPASLGLAKRPKVDMPGQPYNPGHKRNIGVRPPRIKPISTRDYSKTEQATDPSRYFRSGFKGGEA